MTPREGAMTEGKPNDTCNFCGNIRLHHDLIMSHPFMGYQLEAEGKQAAVKECVQCKGCGTVYPASSRFCPDCGRDSEVIARHAAPAVTPQGEVDRDDPPTPEQRELAKAYLREWSHRYRVHGHLANIEWDGAQAEYHLANFLKRQLASPAVNQELKEALRELLSVVKRSDAEQDGCVSDREYQVAIKRAERVLSEEETKA